MTEKKDVNRGGRPPGLAPATILKELLLEILEKKKCRAGAKAILKRAIHEGKDLTFLSQILRIIDDAPLVEDEGDEFTRMSTAELEDIINAPRVEIDIEDDEPVAVVLPTRPVAIVAEREPDTIERAPDPTPEKTIPVPYTHPDDASEAIGDEDDGYDERDCGGWEVITGRRDGPGRGLFGGADGRGNGARGRGRL